MNKISLLVAANLALLQPITTFAAEGLNVVVVTAQKEEQNINDVPLTVTAFLAEQIEDMGLSQPSDLSQHVPGLFIKPTVGDQNPVITIRGIGFNDFTSIQNPGAGVYVDQVIVPYHTMMSFQLLDLERVEVLKGPQGTLYGRNSTAGAINFVSAKPSQDTEAKIRLEYSSWDTTEAAFAFGSGLTENLSYRFAYNQFKRTDPYQTNRVDPNDDIGEKDRNSYRFSLLWESNDQFDALLNIHGGTDNSANIAVEHLATLDATTFAEPCAPVAAGNRAEGQCINAAGYFDPDDDPHAGDYSVINGGVDNNEIGVALTMNWYLDDSLTITSVTGYDEFDRLQAFDADGSPFVFVDVLFDDTTEAFSQELRVTKKTDASTWIAGVFYSDDSVKANQRINTTQLFGGDPAVDDIGADVINNQDSTSLAVFANANFELSPKLTLLTGLRYTSEEKDWNGGSSFPALGVANMTELSIDDTDISGRIGLEYRPQDKTLVYATASKGFRSGGFPGGFAPLPEQLQAFKAENVFAYELGSKMTLLENSLQFNIAAFYYDWQKIQTQFTESRGGIIAAFLTNAGDADIKGIDADLSWAATEQLFIRAGLNWMDTEITSEDARLDNRQLANAPELTYNLAIEYFVPLNNNYELLFGFDANYTDEVFFTVTNEPVFHEDSYWLTNARISFMPTDGNWKVTLWGKNLGDKNYRVEGFNQFGFSGDSYFTYGEPGSYGIRVSYEFL